AVSAAASIGVHLAHAGFGLRLLTDRGQVVPAPGALGGVEGAPFEDMLLDTLAVLPPARGSSMREGATALRRDGDEGLLIAVLGALDHAEAEHLARLPNGRALHVALLLDVASWSGLSGSGRERAEEAHAATAVLLRRGGWRVLPVGADTDLAAVWPQV